MGELVRGRTHLEKALELYEPQLHRESVTTYGTDLRTVAGEVLCVNLCLLGFPDQALMEALDVLRHGRQLGHPFSVASALEYVHHMRTLRAEYRAAHEVATQLEQIASKYGFEEYASTARVQLSMVSALQAPADRHAIIQLKRDVTADLHDYSQPFAPYILGLLATAMSLAGGEDEALEVIENAMATAHRRGEHWFDAESHRLKGKLLLANNVTKRNMGDAEHHFEQALDISRCQQAKWLELRAANNLARLWKQHGKSADACDLLAGVYD